jgi:hypothetical protein
MGVGRVRRYEIPGLLAFNFIIDHALAGGASRSLRLDTQGKALGTVLLEMRIPAPEDVPAARRVQKHDRNLVGRESRPWRFSL